MLKFIRSVLSPQPPANAPSAVLIEPPGQLEAPGVESFAFAESLQFVNSLPVPDWAAVSRWVESISLKSDQAEAWTDAERAWLLHLGAALGPRHRLSEQGGMAVLSALEPNIVRATLEFMSRTQSRITRVLEGVAVTPSWGKDILVVFEDQESYYNYVSRYYPDAGEFAISGGMHIDAGCGHFVTVQNDLRMVEPVIAHEMTHGCLSHLPLPAWLNEGLAVNTENRLCPPQQVALYTPSQMHGKHLAFWGPNKIQEFWSGKSFRRSDEGNMLSYDLARIIVEQFASEWSAFRDFCLDANLADAGATAARRHLGIDLGEAVSALLERENAKGYRPEPALWDAPPEKGAFTEKQACEE